MNPTVAISAPLTAFIGAAPAERAAMNRPCRPESPAADFVSISPLMRRKPPRESAWGSVHPLLDLHGLTGDEAVRRATAWLLTQRAHGERTVVVVTGRGNRSPGIPVLRAEVEHLLESLRGELVVRWEPTEGGGAFRVQLAPPAPVRTTLQDRRTAQRLAAAGPALRARAEEALWELGITPTPALIDAEIRRMQESGEGSRED